MSESKSDFIVFYIAFCTMLVLISVNLCAKESNKRLDRIERKIDKQSNIPNPNDYVWSKGE